MTEADENEPGRAEALRLFFALWPEDATRDALDRTGKWLHQRWGGRRMRAETVHITLAFLGETPAERLDVLLACADSVHTGAYDLVLDQAGYWRHNRIGWLGASEMPPRHLDLVQALTAALKAADFPVDSRPHVPHVTLLRKSRGGEVPTCTPVIWPIRDFVLVRSVLEFDGAHYEVVRRWPLGKRPASEGDCDSGAGD